MMVCMRCAIMVALLCATAFGQDTSGPAKPQSCSDVFRNGRRIVSQHAIVEFHVPLFAHLKKVRDVDYVEYYVRYGPERDKLWLKFMFGTTVGGGSPHELEHASIKWKAQKWGCHHDEDGTDWRGTGQDGKRWRHISIPFGFASYANAPAKAAEYFDKILDTMCCGKCPTCRK